MYKNYKNNFYMYLFSLLPTPQYATSIFGLNATFLKKGVKR